MRTRSPDRFSINHRGLRLVASTSWVVALTLMSGGLRAADPSKPDSHQEIGAISAQTHRDCCSNTQEMAEGQTTNSMDKPLEVGPAIGQKAPTFTLKDQHGKDVALEELLKKGPVALVFYRSADWCLACKFELQNFQHRLKDFEAAGGQVVGISYDSVPILKRLSDKHSIAFPMLSDAGSKVIDAYNVRDAQATDPSNRFAAHASFVIDQSGVVRAKFVGVIYQEQPGMGILLKGIKEARNNQPKAAKAG